MAWAISSRPVSSQSHVGSCVRMISAHGRNRGSSDPAAVDATSPKQSSKASRSCSKAVQFTGAQLEMLILGAAHLAMSLLALKPHLMASFSGVVDMATQVVPHVPLDLKSICRSQMLIEGAEPPPDAPQHTSDDTHATGHRALATRLRSQMKGFDCRALKYHKQPWPKSSVNVVSSISSVGILHPPVCFMGAPFASSGSGSLKNNS
mmetsp:Transcript_3050/g.9262  ORF Transcript_3050/g.9262 Transcript_3050/m.9262 type:complete len:206 (-) Transcript_3050:2479-3096(-)